MKRAKISSDSILLSKPSVHNVCIHFFIHTLSVRSGLGPVLGTQGPIQIRQVSSLPVNSSYMWKLSHVEMRASPTVAVRTAFWTEPRESFVGVGSGRVLSRKALFKALGPGLERQTRG